MERIVVTRNPPGRALEMLDPHGEVWLWPENEVIPRSILLEQVTRATALYSMLTDRIDRELMDAAPLLRVISNMAVGVDNVNLEEAAARGIAVGHTPDVLSETTADTAFALLLAAARRLREGLEYVTTGQWHDWDPELLWGFDVHGSTLGVVGMGRLGRAIARRAAGFEMEVIYHTRSGTRDVARWVDLPTLLERSDHVVVAVPLTEATRGMIGEAELRSMRRTATLVNIARGPVVDTAALIRALREGWIFAAGLDVTDPEPLPGDHPLARLPNCFVIPHLGSSTERTRAAMAELAARNVIAGLRGEVLPAGFSNARA